MYALLDIPVDEEFVLLSHSPYFLGFRTAIRSRAKVREGRALTQERGRDSSRNMLHRLDKGMTFEEMEVLAEVMDGQAEEMAQNNEGSNFLSEEQFRDQIAEVARIDKNLAKKLKRTINVRSQTMRHREREIVPEATEPSDKSQVESSLHEEEFPPPLKRPPSISP